MERQHFLKEAKKMAKENNQIETTAQEIAIDASAIDVDTSVEYPTPTDELEKRVEKIEIALRAAGLMQLQPIAVDETASV